jgi:hypothetical protein
MLAIAVFAVTATTCWSAAWLIRWRSSRPDARWLSSMPGRSSSNLGLVFAYGLMIVAPSVIVMLLLDVGLAIAARTMPQMNIFIVAMPLKVLVGLFTLAVSMRYLAPALFRVYESIGLYWQKLFS